jgi:secondary thiamine-phosphate synthase enzyme
MVKIEVKTQYTSQIIDITSPIEEVVIKRGITDGVALLYLPHTTAGLLLFEKSDISLRRELLTILNQLLPEKEYTHPNARAHLKAAFLKSSISLIIKNGKIVLGKWQGLFLIELDGPRTREILVKVVPDGV